ncbi:MAG: 3-dehydroquinate synthase [Cytophagales bacterium]
MIPSNIFIGKSLQVEVKDFFTKNNFSKIGVLVDENTLAHCYPVLKNYIPAHFVIEIKSGEENKNLDTCTHIWNELTKHQLDRKALLINLGGGVIGDMGGFCAATYKRGINFVQMPTTLLSMVDASVGGKLGVDFDGFKNHIGVFQEPMAVFIDSMFLNTLSIRELRSGFAEIIKHNLIADTQAWGAMKTKKMSEFVWEDTIKHSVGIKANVTAKDPKENGLRKILNFGHTLGHAVESYLLPQGDRKLLHGEAIAVGMIVEAWLACEKKFIKPAELKEITNYIISVYGLVSLSADDIKQLVPLTLQDKKNESNAVLFSLLEKVGVANYNIEITENEMYDAMYYYMSL